MFLRLSPVGWFLLILFMLVFQPFQNASLAQDHIEVRPGATNRFEKADVIYGVYGDISYPLGTQPIHYNRIYVMEGQYAESDYTYVALGWYRNSGVGVQVTPVFYYRKPNGTIFSGVATISFFVNETHNYGIEYRYSEGKFRFYIDGIDRGNVSSVGLMAEADSAVAGAWISPNGGTDPVIGATYSTLQWVKRKATGALVRKPWTFNFADLRNGSYTCTAASATQITCNRTF